MSLFSRHTMFALCLLTSLFYVTGKCHDLLVPLNQNVDHKLIECISNILDKYFNEQIALTYVNMHADDDELLRVIHSTVTLSLISRKSTHQMHTPNQGYLISSADVRNFTEYFDYLIREQAWNPYARFLIVIKTLQNAELNLIFDSLLKRHVNNVLVVNGTKDAHLYTYNPYDNYACGKYYETITSYGLCSQSSNNLYPNKLVTGLKKCTFIASIAHRPPLSIDPSIVKLGGTLLGMEEYIITLLGNVEEFKVNFIYDYDGNEYSTVLPNMTATGPMARLQSDEVDVIFGGMMLVTTRTGAFTYLTGYYDYCDELKFAVKVAGFVPIWKNIYLEFEFSVWVLSLIAFISYAIIVIILLKSEDIGEIVLRLFDNLLLHGRDVPTRLTAKCVLMSWVWFAYLLNTFYQSSLFSLTTHPSMDFQVSNEEDMRRYNFKPCFSIAFQTYLASEEETERTRAPVITKGCETVLSVLETVSIHNYKFTIVPNYVALYHEPKYINTWGEPMIHYFEKPYAQFLFGYFFWKGFPITKRLQLNTLRMKESGLAEKRIHDHFYVRRLKRKISQRPFETRFLLPWTIYIPGLIISTTTFIIELLTKKWSWLRTLPIKLKVHDCIRPTQN